MFAKNSGRFKRIASRKLFFVTNLVRQKPFIVHPTHQHNHIIEEISQHNLVFHRICRSLFGCVSSLTQCSLNWFLGGFRKSKFHFQSSCILSQDKTRSRQLKNNVPHTLTPCLFQKNKGFSQQLKLNAFKKQINQIFLDTNNKKTKRSYSNYNYNKYKSIYHKQTLNFLIYLISQCVALRKATVYSGKRSQGGIR